MDGDVCVLSFSHCVVPANPAASFVIVPLTITCSYSLGHGLWLSLPHSNMHITSCSCNHSQSIIYASKTATLVYYCSSIQDAPIAPENTNTRAHAHTSKLANMSSTHKQIIPPILGVDRKTKHILYTLNTSLLTDN